MTVKDLPSLLPEECSNEVDMREVFVCGRLCLFGEHSDWAGQYRTSNPSIVPGHTVVVGTQQGLHARVKKAHKVLRIRATNLEGEGLGPVTMDLNPASLLKEAQKGGFWSYVAGTAYQVITHHDVDGLDIENYLTTLPMSKGLSSSAAICVMVARAFNLIYHLKLTIRGEMELAFRGEVTTPSKCGRMDQGCAYGNIPVIMQFDGDLLHVETCPLAMPLYLVLVDLKASKCTTTILTALQSAYPNSTQEDHVSLRGLLGATNEKIVMQALDCMENGDVERLGRLMTEAQREFDRAAVPLCPSQLTSPELHKVLAYPAIQDLIWGGKGVGSQGDGAAQFLCKSAAGQSKVIDILTQELGKHCMPLTVEPTEVAELIKAKHPEGLATSEVNAPVPAVVA